MCYVIVLLSYLNVLLRWLWLSQIVVSVVGQVRNVISLVHSRIMEYNDMDRTIILYNSYTRRVRRRQQIVLVMSRGCLPVSLLVVLIVMQLSCCRAVLMSSRLVL